MKYRITRMLVGTVPALTSGATRWRCAIGHTTGPCPWPAKRGRLRCPECMLVHRSKGRVTA